MDKKHFETEEAATKYANQCGGTLHDNTHNSSCSNKNYTVVTDNSVKPESENINQEYDGRDDFHTFGYPDEYWED